MTHVGGLGFGDKCRLLVAVLRPRYGVVSCNDGVCCVDVEHRGSGHDGQIKVDQCISKWVSWHVFVVAGSLLWFRIAGADPLRSSYDCGQRR